MENKSMSICVDHSVSSLDFCIQVTQDWLGNEDLLRKWLSFLTHQQAIRLFFHSHLPGTCYLASVTVTSTDALSGNEVTFKLLTLACRHNFFNQWHLFMHSVWHASLFPTYCQFPLQLLWYQDSQPYQFNCRWGREIAVALLTSDPMVDFCLLLAWQRLAESCIQHDFRPTALGSVYIYHLQLYLNLCCNPRITILKNTHGEE